MPKKFHALFKWPLNMDVCKAYPTFDVVGTFDTSDPVNQIVKDLRISIQCLWKASVPATKTFFT